MAPRRNARGKRNQEVTLAQWSIRRFVGGAQFFVGYCVERCNGRVSTRIVELDVRARTGLTQSGRLYRLVGWPGIDKDAEYVWLSVADTLGHGEAWTDVTEELFPDAYRVCET